MNKYAVVLAAGKGTRMKSNDDTRSKVSHEILGIPLVNHVLNALQSVNCDEIVTVVGHAGEHTMTLVKDYAKVVWQREQKGTGHAVMQAAPVLEGKEGTTIILCGDTPLLKSETLSNLIEKHVSDGNGVTVLGAIVPNPHGYGRLITDSNGALLKIVEQKNCNEAEDKINFVNTGVLAFNNKLLFECLKELKPNELTHEYYLTDLIEIIRNKGYRVGASTIYGDEEMLGINDRVQLATAARIMRRNINTKLMLSGVTIEDPDTAYISPYAVIEPDAVIRPNTTILGKCHIGSNAVIGPNAYLENVDVESGKTVKNTEIIK